MTSLSLCRARVAALLASAATLAICFAAPVSAVTIEFSDADFNLPGYAITNYAQPGYNTVFNQNGEILNGEFNLHFSYGYSRNGANPAGNRLQAFNLAFVYNPQTQGTITSIDAALDQRNFLTYNNQPVTLTGARAIRVLAMQGGNVYRASTFGALIGAQEVWYGTSVSGLLASNFGLFDPANPNAALGPPGLDFAGSAITFGFELTPFGVVFSGGAPVTGHSSAAWQADNFKLTVNALDIPAGVPKPSVWGLLILGFGVVGAGLRQRRPTRVTLAFR